MTLLNGLEEKVHCSQRITQLLRIKKEKTVNTSSGLTYFVPYCITPLLMPVTDMKSEKCITESYWGAF